MRRAIAMAAVGTLAAVGAPSPPALAQSPAAPDYPVERIGPWTVRSDREAFTLRLRHRGVIEAAAKSADGRLEWVLPDNGVALRGMIVADGCRTTMGETNYPGEGPDGSFGLMLADALKGGPCGFKEHSAELALWSLLLPKVWEAMKKRAADMFPMSNVRCVRPPEANPNPGHPPCGFRTPRIGEAQPW